MTLLGVLKTFSALIGGIVYISSSRQDHVPHDLLEVHLWRDSRIYVIAAPGVSLE